MGGCGGLERTDFEQFSTLGGCGGLERTDFEQFLLWEGVVVLKEHMGDAQGSMGGIQGVFEHMGVLEIRGCLNAWGHPNILGVSRCPKHMGVSTQCPKCRTYMPLKKISSV